MNIIGKIVGWAYRFVDRFWIHSFGRKVFILSEQCAFSALYAIPSSNSNMIFGIDDIDEVKIEASYEGKCLQVGLIVILDDGSQWRLIQQNLVVVILVLAV